ncbi:hypothetical protein BX616_010363 [Lobosporangium transversale]|nr:hypothetical protein BX616_010363 [Lobosporangium transversale]
MPGAYKTGRDDASHLASNSNNSNILGATADSRQTPAATAMRATNVVNPHDSTHAVAGITVGGAPTPYDSRKIELAKEHLVDSANTKDNNTFSTSENKVDHAQHPSLSESVKAGAVTAASTAASTAATAASIAASAGASVIAAAKKRLSHQDDQVTNNNTYSQHESKSTVLPAFEPENERPLGPSDRPPVKAFDKGHELPQSTVVSGKPLGFSDRHFNNKGLELPQSNAEGERPLGQSDRPPTKAFNWKDDKNVSSEITMEASSETKHPIQTTTNDYIPSTAVAPKTAGDDTVASSDSADLHQESLIDKVKKNIMHVFSTPEVPQDNTHQYALTSAQVLLDQQEYAAKHARTGHSSEGALPAKYNTASASAILGTMHPYDSAGAGTSVLLDSDKIKSVDSGVVDRTTPPRATQHSAYLPSSIHTTPAAAAAPVTGHMERDVFKPTEVAPSKAAEVPALTHDNKHADTEHAAPLTTATHTIAEKASEVAAYLSGKKDTTHDQSRPVTEKIKEAVGLQPQPQTMTERAKEAVGIQSAQSRPVTERFKEAVGIQPAPRPVTEKIKEAVGIQPAPRPVTEKIKEAVGIQPQPHTMTERFKETVGIQPQPQPHTMTEKFKEAVGIQPTTTTNTTTEQSRPVTERVKETVGIHSTGANTASTDVKTYNDSRPVTEKIKEAVGIHPTGANTVSTDTGAHSDSRPMTERIKETVGIHTTGANTASADTHNDSRPMTEKIKETVGIHPTGANTASADVKAHNDSRPITEKIKDTVGIHSTGVNTDARAHNDSSTVPIAPETHRHGLTDTVKDAMHSSSEYGPANPKDLDLTNPKSLSHATTTGAATGVSAREGAKPSVPAATTVSQHKPTTFSNDITSADSKRQAFTDTKTLQPTTGTRTVPIAPETHHHGVADKVKDSIHPSSEYGPADPKNLKLTDPKALGLAAAGPTAGVSAKEAIKPSNVHASAADSHTGVPSSATKHAAVPSSAATYGSVPSSAATHGSTPSSAAKHAVAPSTTATHGTLQSPSQHMLQSPPQPQLLHTLHTLRPLQLQHTDKHEAPSSTLNKLSGSGAMGTATATGASMMPHATSAAAAPNITPANTTGTNLNDQGHHTNNTYNTNIRTAHNDGDHGQNIHIASGTTNATAVPPLSYKGTPQVHPGEEVGWMKTTTTTNYYDNDDNNRDAVGHGHQQAGLAPNTHNTTRDATTATTHRVGNNNHHDDNNDTTDSSNDSHGDQKEHHGFIHRLLHRHHHNHSNDKGKQRL